MGLTDLRKADAVILCQVQITASNTVCSRVPPHQTVQDYFNCSLVKASFYIIADSIIKYHKSFIVCVSFYVLYVLSGAIVMEKPAVQQIHNFYSSLFKASTDPKALFCYEKI